ncbi:MAG: four helix bundle protein [Bacteroidales bacterium]|nr:four helix bundle protein [Bacteroidales bacterium]MCF8457523.1 four helix bundle protein [Bacteroidales bacterium]
MATITNFEDLEIWKMARGFCQKVHELIISTELGQDYKLRDQINGSSGSIMDNIAEGFERDGKKEFRQFLYFSKGSCGESRSQLVRACDRKYIDLKTFNEMKEESILIGKKIGAFINYLNKTDFEGRKFKN